MMTLSSSSFLNVKSLIYIYIKKKTYFIHNIKDDEYKNIMEW